jgi:hypothetical protein
MNLTIEDRIVWLVDIRAQLVSNLEETWRRCKENVDTHLKDQPNFKVKDQVWIQQQNIKITQLSKKLNYLTFGPFTIMKQINTLHSNFSFLIPWRFTPSFMFHCWSPTMFLPFQKKHTNHLHQL